MGNLTIALTFVMILNVFMWFGQLAVFQLNPQGTEYFHCEGTLLETFDKTKCAGTPDIDDSELSSQLPSGQGSVSPTSGNIFVDIFSSIKSWFANTAVGIKYLGSILSAPYTILKMIVPAQVAFGIGVVWYAITLLLIIAFIWGREA